MSFGSLMTHTVSRTAYSSTASNATGYPVKGAGTTTTGLVGSLQPTSSRVGLDRQKRTGVTTFDFYYGPDDTWTSGDVLTVTAGPSYIGRSMRAVSLPMDEAGRGHHFLMLFEEVKP